MASKSCFSVEMGTGYFFNRSRYVRADGVNATGNQGPAAIGPVQIFTHWRSLQQAGFDSVDAVLHVGGGVAYFFRGTQYIRVDHIEVGQDTDVLAVAPTDIATGWPSIAAAGFVTVDAALSMGNGVAYFFSDTRYIRVQGIVVGQGGDNVAFGPTEIINEWPSLNNAGFWSVDAVFSVGDNEAYFFSGSRNVRVGNIIVAAGGDHIIGQVNQTVDNWPALAHFW